jgi:hypothetical protein
MDRAEFILTYALSGLALLFFTYELVPHYSIIDDAYISYRFLDNRLVGEGLVFNSGARVEGYTNLLWILLIAPLRLAGLSIEAAATTLSVVVIACLFWAVFQTARNLSGNVNAGWIAVILVSGSVHLVRWTVSGLETALFASLIALANRQLSRNKEHDLLSSRFFGLSVLTGPPDVLQTAVAFGAALFQQGGNLQANSTNTNYNYLRQTH